MLWQIFNEISVITESSTTNNNLKILILRPFKKFNFSFTKIQYLIYIRRDSKNITHRHSHILLSHPLKGKEEKKGEMTYGQCFLNHPVFIMKILVHYPCRYKIELTLQDLSWTTSLKLNIKMLRKTCDNFKIIIISIYSEYFVFNII